jgi:2-oxoacid:acceptor oxidoreductase gamma subunit (pyruvate/2-ketoisovalerate family)/2-oxoacid:acceptor oxidoreductase delta subunit (pyruvate/2-ketoisovalerate family)
MIEIRGHARGGQGMVTAFEIMARIFSRLDDFHVQAFPAFGVERTGAPIQAFLRVARRPILNRSNIYHPHLIIVFDESLLEQVPVFSGLRPEGAVLINTDKQPDDFAHLPNMTYAVPATRISLALGLGSKSLPIVNAAMMGAIIRILNGDLSIAQELIRQNVPAKPDANAEAARRAYEQIRGLDRPNDWLIGLLNSVKNKEEEELERELEWNVQEPQGFAAPFWNTPMTANKTGNWRLLTPSYTDKTPPCNATCPAGTDVRKFVRLAGERKFNAAFNALYETNPFPAICGRVCPHFCEQNCNRNDLDEGLNIGAIERFLGDRYDDLPAEASPILHEEKIAVVGSGPAGLTAAVQLRRKGYAVDVYEAEGQAGGMMRTGIPRFRLPDQVLDREIKRIEQQGVNILYNQKVQVKAISGKYAAVVAAVGSHRGVRLNLDNDEHVTEGLTFLRNFKLLGDADGIEKGQQVAVIGGGNTAVDVARTALRLGAEPTIYYRRTIREMPAIAGEVEEALAEGTHIEFLTAPTNIRPWRNRLELTLVEMELGSPDDSGRRRPIPMLETERSIHVDKVIAAIGQRFDDFVFEQKKTQPTQGRIEWSGETPVFCAGDMAWGGTVTEAIGSGNAVAEEVHAHLRGMAYKGASTPLIGVKAGDINQEYYLRIPRHRTKIRHPEELYHDFSEIAVGLETEELIAESSRCLHCGECFSCGNCYNFCPDSAIHIDEQGRLRIDYDYCKGCGICVEECPCSAMKFELEEC